MRNIRKLENLWFQIIKSSWRLGLVFYWSLDRKISRSDLVPSTLEHSIRFCRLIFVGWMVMNNIICRVVPCLPFSGPKENIKCCTDNIYRRCYQKNNLLTKIVRAWGFWNNISILPAIALLSAVRITNFVTIRTSDITQTYLSINKMASSYWCK